MGAILSAVGGFASKVPAVWYAVIAVVVILGGFAGVQTLRLHSAQSNLTVSKAQLAVANNDLQVLGNKVADQNAAVERLKAAGAAQVAQVAQAQAASSAPLAVAQTRIQTIEKTVIAPGCQAAIDYLIDEAPAASDWGDSK